MQKKYILRHKGIPGVWESNRYPNSEGEWYYCRRYNDIISHGTWRHKSKIKYPIISDMFGEVYERFNRMTTKIYKNDQIEMVELTNDLAQEFTFSLIANY
jgi:hypothetical protein